MSDIEMKNYIMFIEKSELSVSLISLGYIHDHLEAWGLTEEGDIESIADPHTIWKYVFHTGRDNDEYWSKYWCQRRRPKWIQTDVTVRHDFVEMYESLCKRGRTKEKIMQLMSEAIKAKRASFSEQVAGNPQKTEDA